MSPVRLARCVALTVLGLAGGTVHAHDAPPPRAAPYGEAPVAQAPVAPAPVPAAPYGWIWQGTWQNGAWQGQWVPATAWPTQVLPQTWYGAGGYGGGYGGGVMLIPGTTGPARACTETRTETTEIEDAPSRRRVLPRRHKDKRVYIGS